MVSGQVVKRIEEGMDRREVAYTTYQMRNTFRQFYDGVADSLDVHCYMQHAIAADLVPTLGRVLDVCCGRGLLIPFLRYRDARPAIYVGVDAVPGNARWKDGADPRRESEQKKDGWGFPTLFVEATVNDMATRVHAALQVAEGAVYPFDTIVYTSAIEHMQPAWQAQSLHECAKLAKADTRLYLTFPVTEPGRSGYDAQYAAHVYEPTDAEVRGWLHDAGWSVVRRDGLCTGARHFKSVLQGEALSIARRMYDAMPREFALPAIAATFPECAEEVAYTCDRLQPGLFGEVA
jgi:SAM-dependent methyltransferase